MTMIIHTPLQNEYGQPVHQKVKCYDIQFSHFPKPKEGKLGWRVNGRALIVATTLEEATAMVREQYPDDPVIHQAVLRSNDTVVMIAGSVTQKQ